MKRIAIIGAGQAGLYLGIGLLEEGYRVTLYSEQTPEETLHGRARGTSGMFHHALQMERDLGLNFWDDDAHAGDGVYLDFCPEVHQRLIRFHAPFSEPCQAIDQRVKFHRWMHEFEHRGGDLVVWKVTKDDLEAIAASHDLVIVATGKGALSRLFARDDVRSHYRRPRRQLALLTVKDLRPWREVEFQPVKYTMIAPIGEIFWVPFLDRDGGRCYSVVFEAQPGGPLDRFAGLTTDAEVLARAKELIREYAPWEYEYIETARMVHDSAWLAGAITPTVREPLARLASGRAVMGLGDAVVLNDPIGAQGSNNATKHAHCVLRNIVRRGGEPLDADWMVEVFEEHWQRDARYSVAYTNLFLEPMQAATREVVVAASQSEAIAYDLFEGLNEPRSVWPWIDDMREARKHIAERTGAPWLKYALLGRAEIAYNQMKYYVDRALHPHHPAHAPA